MAKIAQDAMTELLLVFDVCSGSILIVLNFHRQSKLHLDIMLLVVNVETFFLQLCTTAEELKQFMQNTLLYVQSQSQSVDIFEQMEESLDSLQKLGHVNISGAVENRKIEVTHLGQATFKGMKID